MQREENEGKGRQTKMGRGNRGKVRKGKEEREDERRAVGGDIKRSRTRREENEGKGRKLG